MEKKIKKKETLNKIKVENNEGLTVSYDKDELNEKFPHLITEIAGKKKSVKIDSIENDIDLKQVKLKFSSPNELVYPNAIDFLRRCTNRNEAINILEYLLKQKEISKKDYNSFKNQILREEGLEEFINKHGGFKGPGYYEKNYRKKTRELRQNKN